MNDPHALTQADIDAALEETEPATQEPAKAPIERKSALAIRGGQIDLENNEQAMRLARAFWQSQLKVSGANSPEDVLMVLMAGMEAGLTPFQAVKNIYIVNGKPTIYGDAVMALVQRTGLLAAYSEDKPSMPEGIPQNWPADYGVTVTATRLSELRNGEWAKLTQSHTFTVRDAANAGLWWGKGPWKQYPVRMLTMRARAFVLRDLFADVLGGVGVFEEVADYGEDPNRGGRRVSSANEQLSALAEKNASKENSDEAGSGSDTAGDASDNEEGVGCEDRNGRGGVRPPVQAEGNQGDDEPAGVRGSEAHTGSAADAGAGPG